MKKFVVNLADGADRRENVKSILQDTLFADFEIYQAFDARKMTEEELREIFDYEKFLQTHKRYPRKGEVGCTMSHRGLWQKISEASEPMLILEDDIRLLRDFTPREMAEAEKWLATPAPRALLLQDFFIYRAADAKRNSAEKCAENSGEKVTNTPLLAMVPPVSTLCTHAYILNPAGAKLLLSQGKPFTVADHWDWYKSLGLEIANVLPPVFGQAQEEFGSTINVNRDDMQFTLRERVILKLRDLRERLLLRLGIWKKF